MHQGLMTLIFKLVSVITFCVALISLGGCQGLKKKTTETSSVHNENIKSRNHKLNQRKTEKRLNDSTSMSLARSEDLTEKEKVFFELSGEKIENLSEIDVYKRCLDKYQKSDEAALDAYVHLMEKRFPKSIYSDNVIYIQGMLAFSQKKYGDSLSSFQKILTAYPQSNKAVSALFAKGIVFKKMNLDSEAKTLLSQVIHQYPGSPESARAELELKMITQ